MIGVDNILTRQISLSEKILLNISAPRLRGLLDAFMALK